MGIRRSPAKRQFYNTGKTKPVFAAQAGSAKGQNGAVAAGIPARSVPKPEKLVAPRAFSIIWRAALPLGVAVLIFLFIHAGWLNVSIKCAPTLDLASFVSCITQSE